MQYQPPLVPPSPEPYFVEHMTPEAFTDSVCAMANKMMARQELPRNYEGLHVLRPLDVKLGLFHLDLEPFYHTSRKDPGLSERLVLADLTALLDSHTHAILRAPLKLVCERVMPRLRNFRDIQHHCLRRQFLYRPVANDCVLHFAVDTGNAFVVIDTDQAKRWGVTFDALETLAIDNLRARTLALDGGTKLNLPDSAYFSIEESEGYPIEFKMGSLGYGDSYDATRLLLPELHSAFASMFGCSFSAVIPSANTLALFPLDIPPPALQMITQRADYLFNSDITRISSHLFTVTADGVAGTQVYLSEEWHDRL